MDKHVVMVSRLWNTPDIAVSVTEGGISVSITLGAFLDAVGKEVGNPTMLFTQAALLDKMKTAATKVVGDMKAETARVM